MRSDIKLALRLPTHYQPCAQRAEQYAGLKHQLHLLGRELQRVKRASDGRIAYRVTYQAITLLFLELSAVHGYLCALWGERNPD